MYSQKNLMQQWTYANRTRDEIDCALFTAPYHVYNELMDEWWRQTNIIRALEHQLGIPQSWDPTPAETRRLKDRVNKTLGGVM